MTVPEKKQMNAGVELLLKRMETHPEEFELENGFNTLSKWGRLIADYQTYLEPEDCEILKQGINKLHQQKFTEQVLEGLVDPKEVSLNSMAHPTATLGQTQRTSTTHNNTNLVHNGGYTLTAGGNGQPTWATTGTNSLSIGNQILDESTVEHMKAHLKSLQQEKAKQHQTLVGKLKNYLHHESN
jgi:hypothetical protein